MKKSVWLTIASLLFAPLALANHYISDNLLTYMHSGPSSKYRIIGSVNAGDKVTLLESDSSTGYSKILDPKNREGWVQTQYVTRKESMAIRLPKVENELKVVKEQLSVAEDLSNKEKAGLIESLDTRNKQISELEQSYSDISQQLTASQTEIRELKAKLDTQKEDLLLKYFMYGGGVAGIGLLLGLVLPHIIPKRKNSPAGWA
ncbi:TIGR04211 family SH3 domain-containing protein [Vibrio sp.]|nr:TIGR04211 family SH3 domain-containing protein [Vibrio sp.]